MADEPSAQRYVALTAVWIGPEEVPIAFVNQFMGQVDDLGEIVLSLGQATPPVIAGDTPEERQAQLSRIPYVPIKTITRFNLSAERARQLVQILQQTLDASSIVKKQLTDQPPPTS